MAKGQKTKELEKEPPIGFTGCNSIASGYLIKVRACHPASPPQNLACPWFPLFWHFPSSLVLTSLDSQLSPHHPHRFSTVYPKQALVLPPNQSSMHSSGQQESSQSSSDLSSAPLPHPLALRAFPFPLRKLSDHGLTLAFPCLAERTQSAYSMVARILLPSALPSYIFLPPRARSVAL